MRRILFSLALCGLFSPALLAEEQLATILQQTELRAEPYSDTAALATLAAKQQVMVLQRQGGWYQVRAASQNGWVRMSHLRLGSAGGTSSGGNGISETLRFLNTGRSGSSGVTVATGIRGLDAADVANARPNHRAVKKLERFQSKPKQIEKFARSAQLKTQPLGYME